MPGRSARPLIIGSGIAGLFVALRARELGLHPTIVTKSGLEESNTRYAQGGIAAAIGSGDSPHRHLEDTVAAGAGLVDRAAAHCLTFEAPARIADLVRYGVPFDTGDGSIALATEAAHSRPRILHAGGDATGLRIEETLRARVLEAGIEARERCVLRRLEPRRGHLVATVSRPDGTGVEELHPSSVVLATGGAGGLFRESSNPSIATGEGVSIAARAGALLTDMEFIQFHPTVFARAGAPRYLLTEALRGEGAVVRNAAGRRFLPEFHPAAELAPRDIVARAIWTELHRTGRRYAYLDATALPRDALYARFPMVCQFLRRHGIDPASEPIPISPAAHYMIGGVATDLSGRSSLRDLYACGEVASTGVHGANRLASNSLLEGLVFGEHVARSLHRPSRGGPPEPARQVTVELVLGEDRDEGSAATRRVQELLWTRVGIVRDAVGLGSALAGFRRLRRRTEPDGSEGLPRPVAHQALLAELIARAALERKESRGAHFRNDAPRPRPAWRVHLGLRLAGRAA